MGPRWRSVFGGENEGRDGRVLVVVGLVAGWFLQGVKIVLVSVTQLWNVMDLQRLDSCCHLHGGWGRGEGAPKKPLLKALIKASFRAYLGSPLPSNPPSPDNISKLRGRRLKKTGLIGGNHSRA